MIGSRPLTSEEVASVLKTFSSTYAARDRALFILGLRSGFRISEMLSLRVSDVWKDGKVAEAVSVARKRMKGNVAARKVPLNLEAAKAIDRTQDYRILEGAYDATGLTGKLGPMPCGRRLPMASMRPSAMIW